MRFLNSRLRPKRFVYFPRYYNERKEKLDLKRKLYADENLSEDDRVSLMREKLKEKRNNQQINQNQLYSKTHDPCCLFLLFLFLAISL